MKVQLRREDFKKYPFVLEITDIIKTEKGIYFSAMNGKYLYPISDYAQVIFMGD